MASPGKISTKSKNCEANHEPRSDSAKPVALEPADGHPVRFRPAYPLARSSPGAARQTHILADCVGRWIAPPGHPPMEAGFLKRQHRNQVGHLRLSGSRVGQYAPFFRAADRTIADRRRCDL